MSKEKSTFQSDHLVCERLQFSCFFYSHQVSFISQSAFQQASEDVLLLVKADVQIYEVSHYCFYCSLWSGCQTTLPQIKAETRAS